jgi:hypothetical protein
LVPIFNYETNFINYETYILEWYVEDFPECCVKESCDEVNSYFYLIKLIIFIDSHEFFTTGHLRYVNDSFSFLQDYKYRNLLAAVSLWAPKESNEP